MPVVGNTAAASTVTERPRTMLASLSGLSLATLFLQNDQVSLIEIHSNKKFPRSARQIGRRFSPPRARRWFYALRTCESPALHRPPFEKSVLFGAMRQLGMSGFLKPKPPAAAASEPLPEAAMAPPQPAAPSSKPTLPPPPPPGYSSAIVLNAQQRAAVEHSAGGLLIVEAGPGSGKTRVIQARVEHLCHVQRVPPHRILVLTFSNKASAELVSRLNLGGSGVRVTAKTFHAYCRQLLCERGSHVGVRPDFSLLKQAEQHKLLHDVLQRDAVGGDGGDGDGGGEVDGPGGGRKRPLASVEDDEEDEEEGGEARSASGVGQHTRLLVAILACKTAVLDEGQRLPGPFSTAAVTTVPGASTWRRFVEAHHMSPDERARVERLTRRYIERQAERNCIDFEDLLIRAVLLLEQPTAASSAVAAQYEHVLVDEFQDTSAVQCRLVAALTATHRNLCLVGDPQQCIYAWRQAERANLASLAALWPAHAVTRLALTCSYRSTQRVLRAAVAILRARLLLDGQGVPSDPHSAHIPDLVSANGEGVPLCMHVYEDAAAEAAGVAHHLELLCGSPEVPAATDAALGALAGLLRTVSAPGRTPPLSPSSTVHRRPLALSDVAILGRTARALRPIEDELKRRGLACTRGDGGAKLGESKPVRAVLAYLRLLVDPSDVGAFKAVAKGCHGLGEQSTQTLADHAVQSGVPVLHVARHAARHDFGGWPAMAKRPSAVAIGALQTLERSLEQMQRRLGGGPEELGPLVRQVIAWLESQAAVEPTQSATEAAASTQSTLDLRQTLHSQANGASLNASSSFAAASSLAPESAATGAGRVGNSKAKAASASASASALTSALASGQLRDAAPTSAPARRTESPRCSEMLEALVRFADDFTDDFTAALHHSGSAAASADAHESGARRAVRGLLSAIGLGEDGGGGKAARLPAITLSTVHAAKGLEWPLVWVVGVEDGQFPHRLGMQSAPTPADAANALREERRLLFVAVTRAQRGVVLSRGLHSPPSPFVRELPVEDGGSVASLFLTASDACRLPSLHGGASEHELAALEDGHAARAWTRYLDRLLARAQHAQHDAQVARFLTSHYGEAGTLPASLEEVEEEDDEDEDKDHSDEGGAEYEAEHVRAARSHRAESAAASAAAPGNDVTSAVTSAPRGVGASRGQMLGCSRGLGSASAVTSGLGGGRLLGNRPSTTSTSSSSASVCDGGGLLSGRQAGVLHGTSRPMVIDACRAAAVPLGSRQRQFGLNCLTRPSGSGGNAAFKVPRRILPRQEGQP